MPNPESEIATRLTLGPGDAGRPLSAEEFAEADYAEPWKYERVRGRLVVMAPDGSEHVETASPWLLYLFGYWRDRPDVVERVVPNAWVRRDDGTDRIGDIGVYLVRGTTDRKLPDRAPDLMFEIVSPGRESHDRDYVEKRADYHRVAIREYVVIDRFRKSVTVFTHAPEGYQEALLGTTEAYTSPLLPGLAIPLSEVFRQ